MSKGTISDLIRTIVGDNESFYFGEVTEVNGVICSVQPIDETQAEFTNIRIVAEESDAGFYPIPKVGSQVIICIIGGNSGYIAMFGELEIIALRGDQYGGLVKIDDLVTKLNNLENKVNGIINTYNLHTHTETGATTSPTTSLVVGTLTNTTKSDLENENVKHG